MTNRAMLWRPIKYDLKSVLNTVMDPPWWP